MEQSEKKEILFQYFFELIDRITRFSTHLEEVKSQFYSGQDTIVKDKLMFISSYEECLIKYFQIATSYFSQINESTLIDFEAVLSKLELLLHSVNDLHKNHLIHLPRPNEPIELRRFGRVIKKQIFNLDSDSKSNIPISIYISEDIGEVSYATDPLQKFKLDNINSLVYDYNINKEFGNIIEEFTGKEVDNENTSIHITISRVDSSNPCHWPSLLHEVSHSLMNGNWFFENDIFSDFKKYVSDQDAIEEFDSLIDENIDFKSWLTECWCDLFACASMGPSFYFSQFHSFLNYFSTQDNVKYPPFLFRLRLLEKILYHRFKSVYRWTDFDYENSYSQSLISYFEKNQKFSFENDKCLTILFQLFKEYFLNHLFKEGNDKKIVLINSELNSKFQKTVRYVNDISPKVIDKLVEELGKGFPIPGYANFDGVIYYERQTTVQEILFSAWVYRNGNFRNKILDLIRINLHNLQGGDIAQLKIVLKDILAKEFSRFDQSILRSIQVSEYFDAFVDDSFNCSGLEFTSMSSSSGLLVDKEIFQMLLDEDIKVMPIMSMQEQLGSTSLDIRLGSTFELYLPNQFGIIDFTEKESLMNISKSAHRVNLDFMEPITLNPGQFILGHSMEYIKLVDTISADLEGRSSFARLGIEIHMTAGFIDPGFEGVLTFEIFNAGPSPVKLYPGMRIGQLRFTRNITPYKSYKKKHAAKYGGLLEYNSSKQNKDYEINRITTLKSFKN